METTDENHNNMLSPKCIILQAVEAMETKAAKLQTINARLETELEQLRTENNQLRQEMNKIKEEQTVLIAEAEMRKNHLETAMENIANIQQQLSEKLEKEVEQTVNSEYLERQQRLESHVAQITAERNRMRDRLQKVEKHNDANFELEFAHKVDELKRERQAGVQLTTINERLLADISSLKSQVENFNAELRNERMRHALLTRQFNSLMEENEHLKRRQKVRSVLTDQVTSHSRITLPDVTRPPTSGEMVSLVRTGSDLACHVLPVDKSDVTATNINREVSDVTGGVRLPTRELSFVDITSKNVPQRETPALLHSHRQRGLSIEDIVNPKEQRALRRYNRRRATKIGIGSILVRQQGTILTTNVSDSKMNSTGPSTSFVAAEQTTNVSTLDDVDNAVVSSPVLRSEHTHGLRLPNV